MVEVGSSHLPPSLQTRKGFFAAIARKRACFNPDPDEVGRWGETDLRGDLQSMHKLLPNLYCMYRYVLGTSFIRYSIRIFKLSNWLVLSRRERCALVQKEKKFPPSFRLLSRTRCLNFFLSRTSRS